MPSRSPRVAARTLNTVLAAPASAAVGDVGAPHSRDDVQALFVADELPAQLDHSVAQERRLLELQVASGFFHLLLEVLHHAGDLVLRDGAGDVFRLLLGHLLDAVGDVADGLADSLRLDAALNVVRFLYSAAALSLFDSAAH